MIGHPFQKGEQSQVPAVLILFWEKKNTSNFQVENSGGKFSEKMGGRKLI